MIIGSARDIVEEHGVARFVFTDFPLGNPCGKPWDEAMQHGIAELAVKLFEAAPAPRTTVQAPFSWPDDGWRERFMSLDDAATLAAQGSARRAEQAAKKQREQAR